MAPHRHMEVVLGEPAPCGPASYGAACTLSGSSTLGPQFTQHLFKLEQAEYEAEGVDWTQVAFVDNQDCVDAFEAMPPKVRTAADLAVREQGTPTICCTVDAEKLMYCTFNCPQPTR